MKRIVLAVVLAVVVVGGAVPGTGAAADHHHLATSDLECTYPLTVEDATGEEVTLEEPPERVVTTAPSAAQTMWEMGAEEKVVGVTEHALYLDGADDRRLVSGEDGALVTEQVVAAEPDIVLAPNATGTERVDQLREAGLTVYHFSLATSLEDVSDHTATIGELTGSCDGAEETLTWMEEELAVVEQAVEGEERPSVLYAFYDFTAGTGTHIHDIIETAGGENVAATAGIEGYEPVNDEIVVDADPEWLVENSMDPALPESAALNETTAVQEDQIVTVDINHINQPAPWNVHAVITLVEAFHPEAYEEASTGATDGTDNESESQETDAETPSASDDGEDDGPLALPGFGAVPAVVAIAGILAYRRAWS